LIALLSLIATATIVHSKRAPPTNVWTDTFAITGLKSYNPFSDVNQGTKLITVYYQNVPLNSSTSATTRRVRFDNNDLLTKGGVVSTTVVFDTKLWYINLLNSPSHFCIFEHLYVKDDKSSFRLLPSTNGGKTSWVQANDVKLVQTGIKLNSTLTNIQYSNVNKYQVEGESYTAQMWQFFVLGYGGKGLFYDVNYYENADNGYPVRFEATFKNEQQAQGLPDTATIVFDVAAAQFYSQMGVNDVFEDSLFTANVRDSCH